MHPIPIRKIQAALSFEENFQKSRHQPQKWLLTYLDVFILIIMLVITLIAISDLKIKKQTETSQEPIQQNDELFTHRNTPITLNPLNKLIDQLNNQLGTEFQSLKPINQSEKTFADKNLQAAFEADKAKQFKEDKPEKENQLSDDVLQQQLKKTVEQLGLSDSVDMKVTMGYAQLEIQDNILFKSSQATLLKDGGKLLKKLTPLLEKSSGLIYIEGHTDDRPIKTARFPSNWELAAARATSVLHFLASEKLNPNRLRAVSFGSTKPIADNATKEGREKNRRVSLVIKISDKVD